MDGVSVSPHRPPIHLFLHAPEISIAPSALRMDWPTKNLHSTSTVKTWPSSNLLTNQGTSGICTVSSHSTVSSNRIPCFVDTD